jgi:SNF2 family DNA or RNA helicase|nr:MAG TPA: Chromatin remodeling complex ATPase [Caudoviricetes sp.]
MKYEPHSYQRYAIEYIKEHPISAILLDMGLGKTSITLSAVADLLFDSFEVSKVLVIAPLRVAKTTWKDEIQKWEHLDILEYSIITGTEAERLSALNMQADIYIINRENIQWLVEKSGVKFDFDMVVIDELSSFKSWQSKRFKAFMKVRPKVKRIVGLTGTPSSNGLMDLFAEFKILDMGERLGRFIGQYRNTYFSPDKRNGQVIYSYKPLPFAEKEIYNKISDITISMKAKDYLKMPELIVNNIEVEMSCKELKLYNKLKSDMVLSINGKELDAPNAAALSNKLLQMANGAVYDDNKAVVEIHDKKLDALEDLIEAANGKPVLVAYCYKHDKERIMQRFQAEEINTSADIDKWNKGEMPVALIHPASAGHGLNLQQGGSTIVWFGLTWSLELYQQLNARLYRQGQKETVVIHHIITKDTIDENVIKALEKKDLSQNSLIEAVKWRLKK